MEQPIVRSGVLEAPAAHVAAAGVLDLLPTSSIPSAGGALSSPTIAIKKQQQQQHQAHSAASLKESVKTSVPALDATDLKGVGSLSNKHRAFLLKGVNYTHACPPLERFD